MDGVRFSRTRLYRAIRKGENGLSVAVFGLLCLIPLAETFSRAFFGHSLPGGSSAVQYLTLVATFVGAALAARANKLLALSTTRWLSGVWREPVRLLVGLITVAITSCLLVAAIELLRVDFQYGTRAVWNIPVWVISLAIPLGLIGVAGWVIRLSGDTAWKRAIVGLGLLAPALIGVLPPSPPAAVSWGLGVVIALATALGLPIFAAVGAGAMLLAWQDGSPLSSVAGEAYRLATSPLLPAIPLFTLAGFILSEGGSGRRLQRLFQAMVGWMPGGLALVTVGLLAFFTPLTGASGITILALGGLLLPMLRNARYPARTSLGLVTTSGSIGVLLPPSLPVILYAFHAELPLEQLFLGGLIPGLLLVVSVAAWGALRGVTSGARRVPFKLRRLWFALLRAKWEVAMPLLLLSALFSGWTTLVETAALTVVYALLVSCVLFREVSINRKLPVIVVKSATLVGGFMIILGVAMALTNYLVMLQVPDIILDGVKAHIDSPLGFLLALNVFLLVVGALMDIYSAIIIVVPLIMPMIAAYELDPLHVGIVFLVNMELGYLMPPMGENLFLSAYRFNRSLPEIYRATLPYIVILLLVTLAVTYCPALTFWPLAAMGYRAF